MKKMYLYLITLMIFTLTATSKLSAQKNTKNLINSKSNNTCLSFDGNDDYLASTSQALNNIGSGDFTIEAVINGDESLQQAHPTIFSNRSTSRNGILFSFHNRWNGSNVKMLNVQIGGVNYLVFNNGTYNSSLLDGNCHHVAVTRKSSELLFYANGQLFGKRTISGNPNISSSTFVSIGKDFVSPSNTNFEGNISQIRIWNTAREQSDINKYQYSRLPQGTNNLMAYWEMYNGPQQSYVTEKINNDHAYWTSTNTTPKWVDNCCPNYSNACLNFDGNDDHLKSNSQALNTIGNGNFTIEAVVNADESLQQAHPTIFSNRSTSRNGILFSFHNRWNGSNVKMLNVQIGGKNYLVFNNGTYNSSLLDKDCHHVAITRNGNELLFYADGQLFGKRTIVGNPSIQTSTPITIGKDFVSPNNTNFEGNISQIRIWNIARKQSDINKDQYSSLPQGTNNLLAYWEVYGNPNQSYVTEKINNDHAYSTSSSTNPKWDTNCCSKYYSNRTTSIEKNILKPNKVVFENNITIQPNPSNGVFELKLNTIEKEVIIKVFNSTGILIHKSNNLNSERARIDLSNYPTGIYFVKISDSNSTITKKIIKK